ncbi:MAG: hypothetical protein ACE5DI_01235 [Candidatus Micrarchaeia archaeon]
MVGEVFGKMTGAFVEAQEFCPLCETMFLSGKCGCDYEKQRW